MSDDQKQQWFAESFAIVRRTHCEGKSVARKNAIGAIARIWVLATPKKKGAADA